MLHSVPFTCLSPLVCYMLWLMRCLSTLHAGGKLCHLLEKTTPLEGLPLCGQGVWSENCMFARLLYIQRGEGAVD